MNNNFSLSVVVPVLNEEESLDLFYNELKPVLNNYSNHEIIFIDDGSDDKSNSIMKRIVELDPNVMMIQFYKNYGKADALSEGFKYASCDIIITIDSDLQDDPRNSPIN